MQAEVPKTVFLLRGVPGSGKSFLSKQILKDFGIVTDDKEILKQYILSTDDYFIDSAGKYNFDPSKIHENHQKNQQKAEQQMIRSVTPLLIDNTNIMEFEMKEYVELADKYGYQVKIINPIDYTTEENPVVIEGKINRDLIRARAQERREDGSGKDINDTVLFGQTGRPGMVDKLESKMYLTAEEVRAAPWPRWHPKGRKDFPRKYAKRREFGDKSKSQKYEYLYLKYKSKYLKLKEKLN